MNPPYRSMLQFQNQLSAPVRQMNLLPKPAPVSKNDTAGTKSDASSDDVTSPDQLTNPKKKHKKSLPFIILILILIIIAVIFLFPKMHTSSDNSSGTSTPKKTADATKEIYKQNETAAYNGIEITMDSYVESEGDDWSVPTEGNEFMFVHMTIVNQTSDDLVISSMASFENYCDDTKLDYSAAAFTALATTSDQPKPRWNDRSRRNPGRISFLWKSH